LNSEVFAIRHSVSNFPHNVSLFIQKINVMKKLLAIVAIAAFTGCGSGNNDSSNGGSDASNSDNGTGNATIGDSIKRASDSVMQTGDTSALNGKMGDSSSTSGSHGQGSGSRVGGGKTGEPHQGKKSKQ